MLNSVRPFAKFLSSLAVVASFGFAAQGNAQTVIGPQLLPTGTAVTIAGGATTSPAQGAACATGSALTSSDAYGDGCLATQIALTTPKYAILDSAGNIFVADYTNGLIRRIDATTGVITAVAGGAASSPGNGSPCGLNSSTDIYGDGCNSKLVKLGKPAGMVFDGTGNLYFADPYNYGVRKVAATSGLIPTTGGTITNVAGYVPTTGSSTYGFTVSNATTPVSVIAATGSYLDAPYDVAFDKNGILYISEEYKNAIVAVNVTTSAKTVYGVTLQPGEIWKVVGTAPNGVVPNTTGPLDTCPNGNSVTGGTYGCNYNAYVEGALAGTNYLDSPYALAFDPAGVLYISDMYEEAVPQVVASGVTTTAAGTQGAKGTSLTVRGPASSTAIGNSFGVASDSLGDIYITDALNGAIWRVDEDTRTLYAVGSGYGKTATPTATASQANPGVFGIFADKYDNLYFGDTINNRISELGNGTNFGIQTSSTVMVHYFKGDSPKVNGYTVATTSTPTTATTFSAVPGNCTSNADGSQDCPVALTVVPTALGPYSGTLTIASTNGTTVTYPLVGVYAPTPVTTTKLTYTTSGTTCTGATNYSTSTAFTFTATVSSVGGNVSGQVQFLNNGVAIPGALITPVNNVATYTTTFTSTGPYSITAKFLGDTYYTTSTSSAVTFTLLAPTLYLTANTSQLSSVTAGQTALYSFNTTSSVYGGNIAFACTNLPANSTCVFSPAVLTQDACGTGAMVAFSIMTKGSTAFTTSGATGRGIWQQLMMLVGLGSALFIGLRRRKFGVRLSSVSMAFALLLAGSGLMACSGGPTPILPATPKGSYTITVTALPANTVTAPTGQSLSVQFPLVVN